MDNTNNIDPRDLNDIMDKQHKRDVEMLLLGAGLAILGKEIIQHGATKSVGEAVNKFIDMI